MQPSPASPILHNLPNLLLVMEARGIEPRSENDSDAATTCVDEAYSVSPPRRLAGHGSNQPLETLTPQPVPGLNWQL